MTDGLLPIIFPRMTIALLLAEIRAFLDREDVNMTETTFGRLAVNDGKFVPRLRNGGSLTFSTAEKVGSFISEYSSKAAVGSRGKESRASQHRESARGIHQPKKRAGAA